ncbi:protein mono-ADP-ribosyltransferase PARP16-like [Anthonomus grandis grandis]|uniref:protein mono-ADP-ribosyltransferase PARP16-like n=1 Tax=Anthonomus grandis grandis TaxID=2921223 RepID=UPI0021669AB1|nr:protein mono-ADP-ribosyltransferase PARP16-like [Anthonomus grandis grandis]
METEERNNILKLDERVEAETEEQSSTSITLKVNVSKTALENDEYSEVDKLKDFISKNLKGCDVAICVVAAALNSFRSDQLLRPFPQSFINDKNEKDFGALKKACDKIPLLSEFITLPSKTIPKDVSNLLTWIFFESGLPMLKLNSLKSLPLSVVNEKASINELPQYVFEVSYNKKFEESWKTRIGQRGIFYAFHGSSVTNFYSILKFGLQQNFNRGKEVIFGNGIYLSNEISVCTNYSPFGETWGNSTLGSKHSIIAVCEVINDVEDVKCKDVKNKRRAINQNSYGEIPENYFVVTNSELVKVKYLLVYRFNSPSIVRSIIRKHLWWILIILYIIMLIFIGMSNSPSYRRFMRYLRSFLE